MIRRCVLTLAVVVGAALPLVNSQVASAHEWHTAQEGDTLSSIAQQHGVSLEVLATANGLEPTSAISAGQELEMAERTGSATNIYIVEPGDSLASIATMYGVSTEEITAINTVEDVQNLRIGTELLSPGNAPSESGYGSNPSATVLDGVPAYQQSRSLSCEYASVYIATSIFGEPIYEDEYINTVAQSANPHYGYRGNIDGVWGNTDDYGIYAEALVPLLQQRGYYGEVSYDPRAEVLRVPLDSGAPVIVWISTRGDTGFYESNETGSFKLVPYEHVVVAYGYDSGGVHISDPGSATLMYYSWDWFLPAWSVMDGMALTIRPA
ncbi:MAG: LysM peptidoglycan-binding domain-containing protein [Chloroflexota bacterium]|nr:LysM peptidoglycan-binding domain-containing protein [Chloroflexota bacterium]